MKNFKLQPFAIWIGLALVTIASLGSPNALAQKKRTLVCKQAALAALKSLPELSYECREDVKEDEAILKWPERIKAIDEFATQLESFTDADWWQTNVDDLNVCDFKQEAGALTGEERQKFEDDYQISLMGNQQVRLVLASDPCYATDFNGSSAFLLSRKGGKVSVTKILDGYYSRIENSVRLAFANLNGQLIIEVSTGNNMPPSVTNYYFVVDPRTKKAVPKKLFKDGQTLTNEITSAMLLAVPSDVGLPKNAEELKVIRGNRLAPTFSVYADDTEGRIDAGGRKLDRTVYRWNGRFYAKIK